MAEGEPSHYYEAFREQYNLIALFAVAGVALVAASWLPLVLGAVGEAAYLLFFADSGLYQRVLNLRRQRKQLAKRGEDLARTVKDLPDEFRERCEELGAAKARILAQASRPEFAGAISLADEISKLEYLYETFVNFCDMAAHYQRYLHDISLESIESDLKRIESQLASSDDARTKSILEKNRSILQKRLERRESLKQSVKNLRAQLEVIENSFRLVNEQMMTMKEPSAIGGELDELISGVEVTSELVKESSNYLEDLRKLQTLTR